MVRSLDCPQSSSALDDVSARLSTLETQMKNFNEEFRLEIQSLGTKINGELKQLGHKFDIEKFEAKIEKQLANHAAAQTKQLNQFYLRSFFGVSFFS